MDCSIGSCAKIAKKRGWCEMHYRRWRVHGSTETLLKRANGDGFICNGYSAKQSNGVKKFDHVLIAEKALGKELPFNAVIHHVNENKMDNSNANLVICKDRAYHNYLHARTRAYEASGNANYIWCQRCKSHFPPNEFRFRAYVSPPFHKHKEMGLNKIGGQFV